MSHHAIEKPQDVHVPASSLWAKLPAVGGALAVLGLGATLGSATGDHKARAMFSYLFAYEAVLALALGALGFVLIDHLVRAAWSTVLRRIAETIAVTLPLFALLWIPIGFMGAHELFPWMAEQTDELIAKKRWFLSNGFFYGRAAIYFAVWSFFSWKLHSTSVKMDTAPEGDRKGLVHSLWTVAAPGLALYALSQSFQSIDWLMSLQPHWYSTMFGVYYFAASILSFFAFITLVAMGLQKAGMLKTAITTEHFHDLGKFVYGFTVFWAYIAFSQYMLIWYANIPEETVFFMTRSQGGWEYISRALPIAHFAVPFLFLLSRHMKRNRVALAVACGWTLVMHCVDMYWLVMPNFGAHGHHAPAHGADAAHGAAQAAGHALPHLAFAWTDAAALVGVAGAFLAVFGFFLKKHPVVGVNEPRLAESLAHENY
ncbi:MAG: hypothetical protein RL653_2274 [Pseudomonadota bacterium]